MPASYSHFIVTKYVAEETLERRDFFGLQVQGIWSVMNRKVMAVWPMMAGTCKYSLWQMRKLRPELEEISFLKPTFRNPFLLARPQSQRFYDLPK